MAPEVSSKLGYDLKADAFSLGIIIYEFQFHNFPKTSDDKIVFFKHQNNIKILPKGKISPSLESLLSALLEFDPAKRVSVKEALSYPWFKNQKTISKFDFI
jgi:serine/threonine protein kinase